MSRTVTPPVADDIAFVLGLPADRQSAVLSALLRQLAGKQGSAAPIPIRTAAGHRSLCLGKFVADPEAVRYLDFLDTLSPPSQEMMTRPLPTDFDPDDSFTSEELAARRAKARSASQLSEPATRGDGLPATVATANSGR